MFSEDEVVIIDQNESILHRFTDSGILTQVASKQGKGPGEVGQPVSTFINPLKKLFYILDLENQFVHEFSSTDFEHINSHRVDFQINFLSRIFTTEDYLLIIGNKEDGDGLIHVFDLESFEYLRSFGDFIDWSSTGIQAFKSMLRTQLYTGSVFKSGNNMVANIDAPYIIRKYGPDNEVIWEVKDDIFQEPWKEHIEITSERYNVGMYPRIYTMKSLDDHSFIVQYVLMEGDRDNWEYWVDIRSVSDGSLEQRFMLHEQMLLHDVAIRENGEVNLLFKKSADYTFATYKLNR